MRVLSRIKLDYITSGLQRLWQYNSLSDNENKKLSCRRPAALWFVSLNISLKSLKVTQYLTGNSTVSISHTRSYCRSIVTTDLSCIISEIKLDISRKSSLFHTPFRAFIRRPIRRSPWEYCHKVRYGNIYNGVATRR